MASVRANDARAFHEFLGAKLANGGGELTLEECLDLWEIDNQSAEERAETLHAIRQGLADVEAGRTRPAEDVVRDLCRKHNLPDPTR